MELCDPHPPDAGGLTAGIPQVDWVSEMVERSWPLLERLAQISREISERGRGTDEKISTGGSGGRPEGGRARRSVP